MDDGSAYCWGYGHPGQLGDGNAWNSPSYSSTPVEVSIPGGYTVLSISAGYFHTCAIVSDGAAYCWGYNSKSELGDGTTTKRTSPVMVSILDYTHTTWDGWEPIKPIAIDAGEDMTCAVMATRTADSTWYQESLFCWGDNEYGQLGDGTETDSSSAKEVNSGLTASSITAGSFHNCAITDDASVVNCWGRNYLGQLGNTWDPNELDSDSGSPDLVRTLLPEGRTATQVDGGYGHTCAIMDDGSVYCWGYNAYSQLGDGTTTNSQTPVPVTMPTGLTATSLEMGFYHGCMIMDDGSAYCWGTNSNGRLGDGTDTDPMTPVQVSLPSGRTATSISAGEGHMCVITDDGNIYCSGKNGYGQLGDGTTTESHTPTAVTMPTGRTATKISVGEDMTCAIMDDESLYCWGYNFHGQLGDGSNTNSNIPVLVSIPANHIATEISASVNFACALLVDQVAATGDQNAYCWGLNNVGQIGDGTTTSRSTPSSVSNIGRSTSLETGNYHVCHIGERT